jgi:hypothetical protein
MNCGEEILDVIDVLRLKLAVRVLKKLMLRAHPPSNVIRVKFPFHAKEQIPSHDELELFHKLVKKILLFKLAKRGCWALVCNHVVRGVKSRAVGEEDERTLPDLQIPGMI